MKYKEWLDVWFANYIEPSSKTKTCERYSEIIEKHLKVKLGEYELEELSPIVIQKYITELMQSGNLTTGKGLAANSVNGIITVIQNSLKLAYTLGELKEYTTDKIRRPKTKEKEVSCFSLAEQKKIEQAALSNKKRKLIGIVKGKAFRSMLWNRKRANRQPCDLIREPLNFCKSVCISSVKVSTRFGIRLLHALWNAEWT